ncbi:MAG: ATP-grasp domain-containing protein [Acetobacterium sp.]
MRIQILGGGNNQLSGIIRAKEKGHEVVLTDYYEDAPGRVYATFNEVVSTFDVDANIRMAVKYRVDGVMTLGTDQPVYTVACVAAAQNLPSFLDIDGARAVTNKEIMKTIFTENEIPTVPYRFINKEVHEADVAGMKFPVVLKPLDSQGQRGVFKLNSPGEVIENLAETLSYSRQEKALVEEYFESDEITVSAWVEAGVTCILTVTDRETFQFEKHIGICFAHDFPSKYMGDYETIKAIIDRITSAFGIKNGPLYVQLLVGKTGILVNEVACRIGGACEDIFIPYLTGIDLVDRVIDFSLGFKPGSSVGGYDPLDNKKHLSVQLFFAKPGEVMHLTAVEQLTELPGVIAAGYNIAKGAILKPIDNATARAGYIVITGATRDVLNNNVDNAFKHLKVINENGENLVIQPKKYSC